jgi:hypothetical protein
MAVTTMLEKVDILRSRFCLSYCDAYAMLERNGGNVIRALMELEDREKASKRNPLDASQHLPGQWEDRISAMCYEWKDKLQQLVHIGQKSKIRIMRGGDTLFQIPTAVGAIGALLFPATAVVTAAALATRYEIVLDKRLCAEDSDTGHEAVVVNVHNETFDELGNGHCQINPPGSSGKVGSV